MLAGVISRASQSYSSKAVLRSELTRQAICSGAHALAPTRTERLERREGEATLSGQPERTPVEELVRGGLRVTHAAHLLWAQFLRPGDSVVDATCGNGGDTLWLSRAVGPSGRVLAIDIQEAALTSTQNLLEWELQSQLWPQVQLLQDCHSNMKAHIEATMAPRLVCFNLGFLPWSDKALMTKPDTTVKAVSAALDLVAVGGIVSVISYVGHEGGPEEHEAVSKLLEALSPQKWVVCTNKILNRPKAPILTLAVKKES